MRKEALYKADPEASCFDQPPMSLTPTQSGSNIDEEVEIIVRDVRYLLMPNQENVWRHQVRKPSAYCFRL